MNALKIIMCVLVMLACLLPGQRSLCHLYGMLRRFLSAQRSASASSLRWISASSASLFSEVSPWIS